MASVVQKWRSNKSEPWSVSRVAQLEAYIAANGLPPCPELRCFDDKIPIETTLQIFNFLDAKSFGRCTMVCRRWRNAIVAEVNRVKRSIVQRRHWCSKLGQPQITKKWATEATAQGIPSTFNYALRSIKVGATRLTSSIDQYDDVVPSGLATRLGKALDVIASQPVKDFHPNTNSTVLDLIHPSLYCYVEGVSKVESPLDETPFSDERHHASLFRQCKFSVSWPGALGDWTCRWLPAEVEVTKGTPKFTSYINNLDTTLVPTLTSALEETLALVLPMFESVLARQGYHQVPLDESSDEDRLPKQKLWNNKKISFANSRLQVIVKAADYIMDANTPEYKGGWHVEGIPDENIVATAIYYYRKDDNIDDAGLSFRREREEDEVDETDVQLGGPAGHQVEFEYENHVELGHASTKEGRIIVFCNNLQHKVDCVSFKQVNPEQKVAKRRILLFWLVDPCTRVISTANVPPQQETLSRDDALKNRLQLMAERSAWAKSANTALERQVTAFYTFCEH